MQNKRPSLDEVFMEITDIFAKRSSCLRRKVGAALVKDGMLISTGYNGAPKKAISCLETGVCLRENVKSGEKLDYCKAAHAEINAIAQAAYCGINTKDSILYCNLQPCNFCAKMIINAGVKEVIYKEDYNDKLAIQLFKEAGVILRKYENKQK